ncbi:MAG: hypothetical protein R2822_21470 [Spirosomataceae bacterium]
MTLKTQHIFSATSTDQLPHHFAAWQMFGHPFLLPVPILTEPILVDQAATPLLPMGSIMATDVANRLKPFKNGEVR